MHLRALFILAWISLNLAAESNKWEVINDVKPVEDVISQEDLLSEEELIPFRAPMPKPRQRLVETEDTDNDAKRNKDTKSRDEVDRVVLPPVKDPVGGTSLDEEHLLPLGVGGGAKRRLLQAAPLVGPRLPQNLELDRLPRLVSEAVNLSTACKESDDEDCLFDVEKVLSDTLEKASKVSTDVGLDDVLHYPADSEEEDAPLSRHKRQANNNNNNNNDDDTSEDGSGVDDLYVPNQNNLYEGVYQIPGNAPLSVVYKGNSSKLTGKEKGDYINEIQKQLKEVFKDFPNAIFQITEPELINGRVVVNWTLLLDGGAAASKWGVNNLEEEIIRALNRSAIPLFNQMTIFGEPIDQSSHLDSKVYIGTVASSLNNYCSTAQQPCGPEYDETKCENRGFMAGTCPHKCTTYGCQNGAVCELNDRYKPKCICGSRYRGQFCEITRKKEKVLSTPEIVGVSLAATIVGGALVSCCCFFLLCRKKSDRNVAYSYYEDEEQFDQVSDPTSIANYYIDRPMISTSPISVFNSNAGFEA